MSAADRVEKDPEPSFPFSMVEKMMPMFPLIAVMGFLLVLISFLVGFFVISDDVNTWFNEIKPSREANADKVSVWRDIHVNETWVVNFKFFGLGLGLLAINMALGTIAKRLRTMGKVISSHIEASKRPVTPEIPKRVKLFQGSAMMGIMILLLTLIIGFIFAFGQVSNYYGGDTQSDLNTYQGDDLGDFGFVSAIPRWMAPLRLLGMGFLLSGIVIALTVIINTLKYQDEVVTNL